MINLEERERLLDRFPLQELELDKLLSFFQCIEGDATASSFFSFCHDDLKEARPALVSMEEKHSLELGRLLALAKEGVFLMGFEDVEETSLLYRLAVFLEATVCLMGRRGGDSFIPRLIFQVCQDEASTANPAALLGLLYRMIVFQSVIQRRPANDDGTLSVPTEDKAWETPPGWVQSMAGTAATTDAAGGVSRINLARWRMWVAESAPLLASCVHTLFYILWMGLDFDNYRPGIPWQLPSIKSPDFVPASTPLLQQVATAAPLLAMGLPQPAQGIKASSMGPQQSPLYSYYALYSSDEQGLSFRRLQRALLGYVGTTMILFGTTDQQVMGYLTEIPWKETGWHGASVEGSDDACLFTISPEWHLYQRTYDNTSFTNGIQYLHAPMSESRGRQGNPSWKQDGGLAIGGVHPDSPRLYLTPSLEGCRAVGDDRPFCAGPLLVKDEAVGRFDIDWIDVYAVRVDSEETFFVGCQAGEQHLSILEGQRLKNSVVKDKSMFLIDLADGVVGSSLYQHRAQARGRANFVAHDDESKGYYVEGKKPSSRVVS